MADFIINFDNQQDKLDINKEFLAQSAEKMFRNLLNNIEIISMSVLSGYSLSEITVELDIMVCDNETIKEINRQYRNKNEETDVITFALFADDETRVAPEGHVHLGEVIISAEKTSLQAVENSRAFEDEFLFLLSHGILHAIGFDHKDEKSLEFMLDIQDKAVESVKNRVGG